MSRLMAGIVVYALFAAVYVVGFCVAKWVGIINCSWWLICIPFVFAWLAQVVFLFISVVIGRAVPVDSGRGVGGNKWR